MARLVLPPIKDTENVTARELQGIGTKTIDNGEPPPGSTGPGSPPDVPLPILDGGDVTVMLAQPSAAEDYGWAQPWFDSRAFNQMRAIADVEDAGHTTAEVFAEFSADGATGWTEPGVSAAKVAVPISATGPQKSPSWVTLGAAAIGERAWRARARGGNAIVTPALKKVHFQFRQGTAPRPPRPPGDLPEDATWGDIVHDLNSGMMGTLYADGADVDLFPDQSPTGFDAGTVATLLLPTYQATGFAGGLPCVEWNGSNVPLGLSNPTEPYGEWTHYFVIDNLDGGDNAGIWTGNGSGSFGIALNCTAASVIARINNFFGGCTATDDWGMSGKHIYRWVKRPSASTSYLFVDGILKCTNGAAPQTSDSNAISMMDYFSGLGMDGKWGRSVAYDKAHFAPDGSTPSLPVDGLTVPELVLQAYWGTP